MAGVWGDGCLYLYQSRWCPQSSHSDPFKIAFPSPSGLCFTSQVWITARCWSRWSEATGCSAPRIVPSHYTSWCCSVGRRMQRSGPPLNTCKPSWRTTLQRPSLSTSPGTTSKPPHPPAPMFSPIGWRAGPAQSVLLQNFPSQDFMVWMCTASSALAKCFQFHHQPPWNTSLSLRLPSLMSELCKYDK